MKASYTEEVEISDHLAAWLFSVHDQHYLRPGEVPDEGFKLGLVEQMGPDSELTDKGRRIAKGLRKRSRELVKRLKAEGVEAEEHALGIFISYEAAEELIQRLRNGEG